MKTCSRYTKKYLAESRGKIADKVIKELYPLLVVDKYVKSIEMSPEDHVTEIIHILMDSKIPSTREIYSSIIGYKYLCSDTEYHGKASKWLMNELVQSGEIIFNKDNIPVFEDEGIYQND